jgi:putative transcriptional regulator
MLRVVIDQILKRKGKTRYWLAHTADLDYISLIKLCNGETSKISFDYIERICTTLECTPNDIFRIT